MHTLGYNIYLQAVLPCIIQLYKYMTLHNILEKLIIFLHEPGGGCFFYEKVQVIF